MNECICPDCQSAHVITGNPAALATPLPEGAAPSLDALERVAAVEHDQWIEWSQTIAREGLTPERIARWQKYWVPYAALDDETKEHDRKWARLALAAYLRESLPQPQDET